MYRACDSRSPAIDSRGARLRRRRMNVHSVVIYSHGWICAIERCFPKRFDRRRVATDGHLVSQCLNCQFLGDWRGTERRIFMKQMLLALLRSEERRVGKE